MTCFLFFRQLQQLNESSWEEDGMVLMSEDLSDISKHVATTHGNGHTFNKTKWALQWNSLCCCLIFFYLDNIQPAHLALSFEMLSAPRSHVLAEACRSVCMQDEGLVPTH